MLLWKWHTDVDDLLHDSLLDAPFEQAPRHYNISDERGWVRWQCKKIRRNPRQACKYRTCRSTKSTCWSGSTCGTMSSSPPVLGDFQSDANDANTIGHGTHCRGKKTRHTCPRRKNTGKSLCQNGHGMSCRRAVGYHPPMQYIVNIGFVPPAKSIAPTRVFLKPFKRPSQKQNGCAGHPPSCTAGQPDACFAATRV